MKTVEESQGRGSGSGKKRGVKPPYVLLVEDNPGDARLVEELLRENSVAANLRWEKSLTDGLDVISQSREGSLEPSLDVVVIDLGLPDSSGSETVEQVVQAAPELPVVVLTGGQDEETALSSLERGVTDYLRKDELTPGLLSRTLRWAVERKQMEIERRNREVKLEHEATHDSLTGLPNRALLQKKIKTILEAGEDAPFSALFFLDLDRFKLVNDRQGHDRGDQHLINVANLLEQEMRDSDLVARVGGDEFAVCLEAVEGTEAVYRIAKRLYDTLDRPLELGDQEVYTPVSIGVVERLSEYDSVADALRDADTAMYRAKEDVQQPFVAYGDSTFQETSWEQKRQFRGLTEGIPGVGYQFYVRPDGGYGIHYVSKQAERVLGLSATPDTFFERFVEQIPSPHREEMIESIDRAVEEERPWRFEMPFERPSGKRIWLLGTSIPQRREEELIFNGVVFDITERKEAERALREERDRFETLFENLPTPVVHGQFDENGQIRVQAVNPAFEELFGVESSSAVGKDIDDLLVPVGKEEEAAKINRRAIDEGRHQLVVRREAADGQRVFQLQIAVRDQKEYPEVYAIYTDVTEEKRGWE